MLSLVTKLLINLQKYQEVHHRSSQQRNSSSVSNRCSYSKENCGSGLTALIISNEEMKYIMKMVKSFEGSGFMITGATVTFKNEEKNKKVGSLPRY